MRLQKFPRSCDQDPPPPICSCGRRPQESQDTTLQRNGHRQVNSGTNASLMSRPSTGPPTLAVSFASISKGGGDPNLIQNPSSSLSPGSIFGLLHPALTHVFPIHPILRESICMATPGSACHMSSTQCWLNSCLGPTPHASNHVLWF